MKNYYLFQAQHLHRKDDTIEVVLSDGTKRSLPVAQIESLYIFNEMTLSTKVLALLSQFEITIHLFNYYGFYIGSFYPKEHNVSGFVLVAQVKALENEKKMLIAKEFIRAALVNIRRNLVYYNNRGALLEEPIAHMNAIQEKIKNITTIESLMGYEGNARKVYYASWREIVPGYELEKRVRRPPDDIVNILISFVNTLLYTTCLSEIYKTQLNPAISYLHQVGRKRFALCLDISEVFKPLLVDRLIFKLLNKRMITENDFIYLEQGTQLKEKSVKIILKAYDEMLNRTIMHKKLKRNVTYRTLIKLECYKIIKYLVDDEVYQAFILEW